MEEKSIIKKKDMIQHEISSSLKFNQRILQSILFLSLAVSGNYIGNMLSCQSQRVLTDNMYVKHIVLLFIIYFTINIASNNIKSPSSLIKDTVIIWISFLLFTKQDIKFTAISAALIMSTYVMDRYIEYFNYQITNRVEHNKKANSKISKMNRFIKYRTYLYYATIAAILIGFGTYAKAKKLEYGPNFKYGTYIFGVKSCKGLV